MKHQKSNSSLGEDVKELRREVKDLKDNHLHVIPEMWKAIQKNTTDLEWLKHFFWKVATPMLTAIGAGVIYIITQV